MPKGLGIFKGTGGGGSYTAGTGIDITGNVISATGGQSTPLQTVKVTLTSAQILNSFTTSIELIAAPGAGKAILMINGLMIGRFNSVPYATYTDCPIRVGANFHYQYMGTNISFTEDIISSLYAADNTYISLSDGENKGVYFVTDIGNPTAGDSTIDLYITYIVITL